MKQHQYRLFILLLALVWLLPAPFAGAAPRLQVHYINVGQGGSTLLIGPDGTTILYDFGKSGGDKYIIPYLKKIGISPEKGLDYTMVSHNDIDHYYGFKALVDEGYDVHVANYGSGSPKVTPSVLEQWKIPAQTTHAGAVRPIQVGLKIHLGNGAEVMVVAANGYVLGASEPIAVRNENDRSISLLVRYGKFHYLLDGDLGGGDEACTGHKASQVNVQEYVAKALLAQKLISPKYGVDVLHIAHHGSESSTPARYYNLMIPEVALVSVGLNQGSFQHPRHDVVQNVLLNPVVCVTAPKVKYLFQTEDGKKINECKPDPACQDSHDPAKPLPECKNVTCVDNSGLTLGDIVLTTDGQTGYEISGTGRVAAGSDNESQNGKVWKFKFDEDLPASP